MQVVILVGVIQLMVYLVGSFVAGAILLGQIPGGWSEIIDRAAASDKLELFDFSLGWSRNYTFWSGLIGGIFITASTNGTDQLLVQRLPLRPLPIRRTPRSYSQRLNCPASVRLLSYSRYYALGLLH